MLFIVIYSIIHISGGNVLFQGSSRTNRSEILTDKYIELVNSGVSSSEILVLLQNKHKQQIFTKKIKSILPVLENPRIYTFFGLAYNVIQDCWADIEQNLSTGNACIIPNLTGLEISQYLFKKALHSENAGFRDYNSKINLLHQLFRRYSLIVQNNLDNNDVDKRSQILGETFAPDAKNVINDFMRLTLKYRAFDYIRQSAIFLKVYEKSTFLKKIKYLIIDDADEITNAEFAFLENFKSQLSDVYIGYDRYGVSRAGFLCGDMSIPQRIEKSFGTEVINLDDIPVVVPKVVFSSFSKRVEMLKEAFEKACFLIKEYSLNSSDVSIVLPEIDSSAEFLAKEILGGKYIKYQIFSGNEKLSSNKFIKNILTVIKLSREDYEGKIDVLDVRSVLHNLLEIPVKDCLSAVSCFNKEGCLKRGIYENIVWENKINTLIETVENLKNNKFSLSEQVRYVVEYLLNTVDSDVIKKINFLVKQISDFEKVFPDKVEDIKFQREIIVQLENTVIAENSADAPIVASDALCIASAQKLIDLNIRSKYLIMLDVSGEIWTREDTGTIYNAWAFQPSWDKSSFTFEDNLQLSSEKIRRQLRKLALLADEKIFAFASLFDINGLENTGGIIDYLDFEKEEKKVNKPFSFTPRIDQKPVLDYKGGMMGISAVPGAGKTTILLALVVKLIKYSINPENIFVLTYMDSAARNFKERIKNICPESDVLPNISTIHGLALRILKENSNFTRVSLSSDFEVCDETLRQKIMRDVITFLRLNHDDFDKYEKAVSALKLSGAKKLISPKFPEIRNFLLFYKLYNRSLREKNLIDYDDMLRLAVHLLEKNADIKEYYQNICRFIIEDEAQDSSKIQQELLTILAGRHKNLIRCGDINQSITTTFTNADTKGFRDFLQGNHSVSMECSQRCARGIYEFANNLVSISKTLPELKNSFYDTKMKEVSGKNPVSINPVEMKIFEDYTAERSYIVSKIREIYARDKNVSIAILLRNNFQIEEYSSFLASAGFDIVTRSDSIGRQPAFRLVLGLLKFINSPWRNDIILEFMDILNEQNIASFSLVDREYVSSLKTPFIQQDVDMIESPELGRLFWDLNYWLEADELSPDEIAVKAGRYYYDSDIEISNIYMISILVKKLSNQYKHMGELIEKLLSLKNSGGRFKFFSNDETSTIVGKIMLMTYHKSKGDEFDHVFIPQLSEDILAMQSDNLKVKAQERFMECIKALNPEYTIKNEKALKENILEENMRLLYVAVTRAKRGLYISCAKKYKKFSKVKDSKPSLLFSITGVTHV